MVEYSPGMPTLFDALALVDNGMGTSVFPQSRSSSLEVAHIRQIVFII
jgi:hypothetical protein